MPKALRGPVLVDEIGRPRFWAVVDAMLDGAGFADSTAVARMSNIERLYVFSATLGGCSVRLDSLIGRVDLQRLDGDLHSFFTSLRNELTRTGKSPIKTWRHATQFASALATRLARADKAASSAELHEYEASLARLAHHLVVPGRRRVQRPRGLPASVLEDLYRLIDPASKTNPFRTPSLRWRNFVIAILLLHAGLRRGEILCLAVDAINEETDLRTGRQRFWLNVLENPYEDDDPRGDPPHFKNALATRQVPVSEETARIVDTYIQSFRGRRKQSFMFFSQCGRPLALRSLGKVFRVLSRCLSPEARRELWNLRRPVRVTPHDLRHTCASVRLHQLVGDDDSRLPMAIQALRPFFGWARDSDMPLLYARTYFEQRLASVWRSDFDERTDIIRRLK